ncbi:MAG: response regulator [Bacteroidetes bacterium]|nr:response regulator [Bacteroidota bacterium]
MQFAFPKNSNLTPELVEQIDKHLGGVEKITIFPFWLKTSLLILFIAIIISFVFILLLKQQVNSKTMQLQKDIAQREKIEKNLKESNIELMRAKKKAEENDYLKSTFLANISHEIRTPMNGILGFTHLLKEQDLTNDNKQEYISIIEKSGNRLLNIINDLIDISKLESGQMDISIKKTNINEVIEYIYNFFKPEVETKGMQLLSKNPLYENNVTIETDPEKFYAILINLVKNAIKYSNKGIIEFGYEVKENYLNFFIKDSGIGIAKDRQKAIFERFIQADISASRNYEGAGLGLSISKAYVKMLGGEIWLESEIGKGSQFYFTIPYNTNKKEIIIPVNTISETQTENQTKNLTILIAEDEETSDIYLTTVIKKLCKKIIHSKTGIEAVEACRQNKDIDLILMDIKMPEMNGYEATKKIRKFNKNVIIIAQTAYALTDDREDALVAGCDDYISKPINKNTLIKIIGKNLRKKVALHKQI